MVDSCGKLGGEMVEIASGPLWQLGSAQAQATEHEHEHEHEREDEDEDE